MPSGDVLLRRPARYLVFVLFFLSGVSGLIYEIVWTRQLATVFGNTVFAVSTVLAAYMAGLALGSFAFGRSIDRGGRPLRLYALLQIGIAVSGVLLTWLLANIDAAAAWLHGVVAGSRLLANLARFAVCFLLLAVPTTLMGGTLPVLSKLLVERRSSLGRYVGLLYALNTLGAAAGCSVAGLVLIGRVGLRSTVWIAALLNALVALMAWLLHPRQEAAPPSKSSPVPSGASSPVPGDPDTLPPSLARLILGVMALSGFAALGYEVVWTKALIFLLGNSVYAFAAMLTTFLIGLALGSLLCAWVVDRGRRLFATLGIVEAGIGVYGILCVQLFAFALASGNSPQAPLPDDWGLSVGTRLFRAFALLFLPTLLMGATFPLATRAYTSRMNRVGRSVGTVYAFNTVGAILGSAVAGFLLIPTLGLQRTALALGVVNLSLGILLCAVEPNLRRRVRSALLAMLICAMVMGLLAVPADAFRKVFERGTRFLYYKEEVTGTVWVEKSAFDRRLYIDRKDMAGTSLHSYDSQKILGHLPMLLHPNPRDAFVLGFGAGGTGYSISTHPQLRRIDAAELCPAVVEAAALFPEINGNILGHPKLSLVVDDGRHFLLTTRRSYDVISVDLLFPDAAGTGSLYTREFYELCSRRLNDDGLMVEWLPPHRLSERNVRVILKTCASVFPHLSLWWSPYYRCLLMVASKSELRISLPRLRERMDHPAVRRDLAQASIRNPYALLSYCIASDAGLSRLWEDESAMNTDDLPLIEYSAPLTRHAEGAIRRLLLESYASTARVPIVGFPAGGSHPSPKAAASLRAARAASRVLQEAAIADGAGDTEAAIARTRQALEIDRDNAVARRKLADMLRSRAVVLARRGLLDQAISLLSEALRAGPGLSETHGKLADLLRMKGRVDEAIHHYRQALRVNPNYATAHYSLGIALASKGNTKEAARHIESALAIEPNLPGAARLLQQLRAANRASPPRR